MISFHGQECRIIAASVKARSLTVQLLDYTLREISLDEIKATGGSFEINAALRRPRKQLQNPNRPPPPPQTP